MATVGFIPKTDNVAWTSYTVSRPGTLPQGQSTLLLQSDEIANNTAQDAMHLILTFNSITPDTASNSFNILTIIQAKDDADNWYNLGYQFSPVRFTGIAPERHIVLDPNLLSFDEGVPVSLDNGSQEIARFSKQRAKLPPTAFRICIYITDYDPSGLNTFQSCVVSAAGEKYDA